MMKNKKIKIENLAVAIFAVGLMSATTLAHADGDYPDKGSTQQIRGAVSSVDSAGGTLTVSAGKSDTNKSGDLLITVPSDARITRGGYVIELADIQTSDSVLVEYVGDPAAGSATARNIEDLTPENSQTYIMRYWLMKSEPDVYSIDDLARDKKTYWDGVRNYQARNFMRDQMTPGDLVFFYHSNAEPPGIAGVAEVASKGYPDPSAFDLKDVHFDPDSKKDKPSWYVVDIKFVKKFKRLISLDELKEIPVLAKMPLLQRGQRLSVQPVSATEWNTIHSFFEI